jgi:hypothetical protein
MMKLRRSSLKTLWVIAGNSASLFVSCRRLEFHCVGHMEPFHFEETVLPDTTAYLFFVVYNIQGGSPSGTGLRVEFTSATLTPE